MERQYLDFKGSVFTFSLLIEKQFLAYGSLVVLFHFYMERKLEGKLW